jgi:hypothetical protein
MGIDNRTRNTFLWYVGVFSLAICLAGAVYFHPSYVINHTSGFSYIGHLVAIVLTTIILIPLIFAGASHTKKICPFALSSVICLSTAPIFLSIAMILDDGFNEYKISSFLFDYCLPASLYTAPILALMSFYHILCRRKPWAGIWFSTAVVGLLTCEILVPTMIKQYKRRHPSPGLVCRSQMNGLYKAMKIYANDFDGKLPTASKWCDLLQFYCDVNTKWLQCPGDKQGPCSYAMNEFVTSTDDTDEVVLLFESKAGWNLAGGVELFGTDNHDGRGGFVLFTNGATRFTKTEELSRLTWHPK